MTDYTDFLVLGKYPFRLRAGDVRIVEGEAHSYYQYMNHRWLETGKNVQAVAWLLETFRRKSPVVEEPFGGCGVFAVAVQELLRPRSHRIYEIDPQCKQQLDFCMEKYGGTSVTLGDSHELMGISQADLYILEIPYFTYLRFLRGEWREELRRCASSRPDMMILTDGMPFMYHVNHKSLQKRGLPIDATKESYVRLMSQALYDDLGYSITGCGHHSTCFYFRLEPRPPGDIDYRFFPAGSGEAGLRKISTQLVSETEKACK